MKRRIFPIKEELDEKFNDNDKKNELKQSNPKTKNITNNHNTNNKEEKVEEYQYDKEIDEEIEKERQKRVQKIKEKEELIQIIKLIKLGKDKQTKDDIKILKNYLCSHYDYFQKLLKNSEDRLLKLIPELKYEEFLPNERIMNFGEEGDKFYLLLKGSVGIYKPFPITKKMTLSQYVEYLSIIKEDKNNKTKFERILNYNSRIDKSQLYLIDFDYKRVPRYTSPITVVLEEERELAQGKAGISFGEMALIKNEPRNATIIALEKCSLISIEKADYTKIVKDIEEQRLMKELIVFKERFPIFKYWPSSKCFPLLSGLITQEFSRDEYVYKQNDYPNEIYIIQEGVFEVSSYFNFDTYENFIEYIHDTTHSLIPYIDNAHQWKEDKNARRIEAAFKNNLSPFIVNEVLEDKIILSHKEKKILSGKENIAKNLEDELSKNKRLIFKCNVQKLYAPDIFGFIEVLELKQRLCSIKCISNKGILIKFPMREFLQLLPTDKRNNFYLQKRIYEEKKYLIAQLKNTAMAKLDFVKVDIDKNLFIRKDFFKIKPKRKGVLELKNVKILPDTDLSASLNQNSRFLIKSNSSVFNSSSLMSNNISKFSSNETSNENKNNLNFPMQQIFKHSRNHIISGFKNSILSLTKKKINAIKNLYPHEDIRLKPSFLSSNNIKEIDNSEREYTNYLRNNIQYAKTPSRLGNKKLNDFNLMTGKKYTSFEADKIINEMNRQQKLMRKVTIENKKNYGILLPSVKINQRNEKKTKSEIVKIKKIKFKPGNV